MEYVPVNYDNTFFEQHLHHLGLPYEKEFFKPSDSADIRRVKSFEFL